MPMGTRRRGIGDELTALQLRPNTCTYSETIYVANRMISTCIQSGIAITARAQGSLTGDGLSAGFDYALVSEREGSLDIGAQAREALRRIAAALDEAGAGLEHVVRTRMFVTDIVGGRKSGERTERCSVRSGQLLPWSR